MSIRLRLTLLFSAILAATLVVFSLALYTVQAEFTLNSLKRDLAASSEGFVQAILRTYLHPRPADGMGGAPPPMPFQKFSSELAFQKLPEREISRVLNASGALVASPFGNEEALPLEQAGLQALQNQQVWWQTAAVGDQELLIYSRPVSDGGQLIYIAQLARPLTERNRSLQALASSLAVAGLVTTLAAFGIGWAMAGLTLRPIDRITQTAQGIGTERDFTRRVNYAGPLDEVGRLATTFNLMLARLQEAYTRVARSLEMQRNFVADVSHELRTPLTTLRGNLGLLQRRPALPAEEQSDIVSDMVDESDRMIRLVNDLLVLARADAGRSIHTEPLAAYPVMDEACRQARLAAPAREIRLEAPLELALLGDRDAFKQVLLILLDNALKHTTGGVTLSGRVEGGQVLVTVSDQGPGLEPDKLAHVFDRFYRAENTTQPGFGLGLPIARALVEGQGGTIEMESDPAAGSQVTLRLPGAAAGKTSPLVII